MNRSRWWILGLTAIAAVAFTTGRWSASSEAPKDPLRDLTATRFEWLGLTSAQAAEIDRLHPTYEEVITKTSEQQNQARCRLVHALTAEDWDAEQAWEAVQQMCATHKVGEEATLAYLEQVRTILTSEQRTRLMARVGECLCTECANDEGACCVITREAQQHHAHN